MKEKSGIREALEFTRAELLAVRDSKGCWTGELSSSGLSTATAVCALALVDRHVQNATSGHQTVIKRGLEWLARNVNADGGWGDTDLSLSNISTTTLVWAAFGSVPGADEKYRSIVRGAEKWLTDRAGGTQPKQLARSILQRYGNDRTFSVPILTMCAVAGRLGAGKDAWREVLPLPFELAAFPHEWFAALRLPVVSYALPALIAIGQARHFHRPTRNPFTRVMRNLLRERTLEKLGRIQPSSGGFLEATPLTSFVTMSLAASGQVAHPVTQLAIRFLERSARADGSWPIDTNLATWVTTLSVNALARDFDFKWGVDEAAAIRDWLLEQQYREVHPYTNAAPGGWAWTNLPGGVPDADDTPGALLALKHLGLDHNQIQDAVIPGVTWLLNLQNRDGGIPTFCRGWGKLGFDQSSPDLTAHAIRAWETWIGEVPAEVRTRISKAMMRARVFLKKVQSPEGSWIPLWFGNQFAPNDENKVYGTSRVLLSFHAGNRSQMDPPIPELNQGFAWLLKRQNEDGGWGDAGEGKSTIEETALVLETLASQLRIFPNDAAVFRETKEALFRGVDWLLERIESGTWKQPNPIGFYFAKLWYYERLYPMIFTVGALGAVSAVLDREEMEQ